MIKVKIWNKRDRIWEPDPNEFSMDEINSGDYNVSAYVGLMDCQKQDIYMYDILRWSKMVYVISFDRKSQRVMCYTDKTLKVQCFEFSHDIAEKSKVIGSLFCNSELLDPDNINVKIGEWIEFRQEGMKPLLHGKVTKKMSTYVQVRCKNNCIRYVGYESILGNCKKPSRKKRG